MCTSPMSQDPYFLLTRRPVSSELHDLDVLYFIGVKGGFEWELHIPYAFISFHSFPSIASINLNLQIIQLENILKFSSKLHLSPRIGVIWNLICNRSLIFITISTLETRSLGVSYRLQCLWQLRISSTYLSIHPSIHLILFFPHIISLIIY